MERSLLGLLDAIDTNRYEVDLFLLRHEGELMPFIPDKVHLLPEVPVYTVFEHPMTQTLKEGHILLTIARFVGKVAAQRYAKKHAQKESIVSIDYSHKYTKRFLPDIQPDVEYDLAISFLTPHYIVAEKVRSKKKIAWIHTDYSKLGIDQPSELKMWGRMDAIISISDAVTETFTEVFPTLKNKITEIENILPKNLILHQAGVTDVSSEMPDDGTVKLLTIGRFSHPKRMDEIPELCRRVRDGGLPVRWYLIGYGGDEPLIRRRIAENHMEKFVIVLGKKENPYPYISACDVYVQPSRYEGKCVAVREAQVLGKPVVITNYATSASQLEDGVDGAIVPMDIEACAEGISAVLKDKQLQEKFVDNCKIRDYSNAREVEKLYRMMQA